MPAISLFSSIYCRADELAAAAAEATGYRLVTDREILEEANRLSGISTARLEESFFFRTASFNPFLYELENTVVWLKLALALQLEKGSVLIHGFSAPLLPEWLDPVLRVLVLAGREFRIGLAAETLGCSESEAWRRIRKADGQRQFWVSFLSGASDAWDSDLYDIVLPADKASLKEAVEVISRALDSTPLKERNPNRNSSDFLSSARIQVHLAKHGYAAGVEVQQQDVSLTLYRPVIMHEKLEKELQRLVMEADEFDSGRVEVKVAGNHRSPFSYRRFETPVKVLLVDDEREFVQTLSERLRMREIDSSVVYDGESAMDMVHEDTPEVMVLDLQMPGIDGVEVLKRVKARNPEIEVVILTGHGTDADRDVCMELGAFAYLEKPVDIDTLSETLEKAYDRMRRRKSRL
ncbi:MAG TPA: response regulator [Desulfobacteraceae bacterium]|jgi:two-component system, OmpR family, response regulator CpxR|nr:response regulator [Desulfobacteraceae bacterium]